MYRNYFRRSDSSEQQIYDQLLRGLEAAVDPSLLENLHKLSFIMFKPDAYLRGLVPSIMQVLIENHIFPIKWTRMELDSAAIDKLYLFVKPKYLSSWWIMEKSYHAGACVPTIVVGDPQGYETLSLRIRDLVGPTTPIVGKPEHIRYRFRGSHRIFNILHGTDDPASAVREALVFFGFQELHHALEVAQTVPRAGEQLCSKPQEGFSDLLPAGPMETSKNVAQFNLKRELAKDISRETDLLVREFATLVDGALLSKEHRRMLEWLEKSGPSLQMMLRDEGKVLEMGFPLREESSKLRGIRELEQILCYTGVHATTSLFELLDRVVKAFAEPLALVGRFERLKGYYGVLHLLADDISLLKAGMRPILEYIGQSGHRASDLELLTIEASLSVMETEFHDYTTDYTRVILGD